MAIEDRAIVQERVIAAAPERIFAAFREPEQMARWLVPGDMERASVEADFRVGGHFSVVMHGSEGDYGQTGEYLEIDPPKRLVFTWVSDFVPEAESHTRVAVTLEPLESGHTRLVLVHDQLPDSDTYDGHDGGWASILAKLEALASKEENT